MAKMYHEAPISFMQKYPQHNYLIEYPWLKDMSALEVQDYNSWILDCGIAISKQPPPVEDYIHAIDTFHPKMVVALDVSDDQDILMESYTRFTEALIARRRWTPQIMWPLRGATQADMIEVAKKVFRLHKSALFGKPLFGIPYRKFTVTKSPSSVNARERMKFIYKLRTLFDDRIDIHLLGLWDMSEVCALNALQIASVDSSFCLLLATDPTNKSVDVWHPRDPRDGVAAALLRYKEGGGARQYDEKIKKLMYRVEMDCATMGARSVEV